MSVGQGFPESPANHVVLKERTGMTVVKHVTVLEITTYATT